MGRAIYLNDELGVEADEIDNVSIDRMLTAELPASELAITQLAPENCFGSRILGA